MDNHIAQNITLRYMRIQM